MIVAIDADDDHDHERLLRAAHDDSEDVAADLVLPERVIADREREQAQRRATAVLDVDRRCSRCTATSRRTSSRRRRHRPR